MKKEKLNLESPDLIFRETGWTEEELIIELEALSAYSNGSKDNLFTAALELIKRRDAHVTLLNKKVDELQDLLKKSVFDVFPDFKRDYEMLEQERQVLTVECQRLAKLVEAYKSFIPQDKDLSAKNCID